MEGGLVMSTPAPDDPQPTAPSLTAPSLTAEITQWLFREAELLDDGFERKWLEEMVSKDVVYQVPLRQTVERARGAGWVDGTFHLDERYGSLETRVARNETAYAWAEDPPSRIRHFVTNVRAAERPGGLIAVRSNLLIYRTRQDQVVPQMLSGERHDTLRREDGALRLTERRVLLDLTAIGTHNLSIFF
jgi:ethylbenzene dioxygenase beta subunit